MNLNCICQQCSKRFHRKPYAIKMGRGKYCSKKCFNQSKMGHIPWNKGISWSSEIRIKISQHNKGKIAWNKGKKRAWKSPSFLKGQPAWNKGKHNWWAMGEKNHNWKGGISEINRDKRTQEMSTLEYKIWRREVFERDNYTCVWCGSNKSGTLQADHIKPWALYPELRYAIDNGRTLCVNCHRQTDSWGFKGIPRAERRVFLRPY